jgi:hypothetical protein
MWDYMWDLLAISSIKYKSEPANSPLALICEWPLEDSNLQPKDYESSALPLS